MAFIRISPGEKGKREKEKGEKDKVEFFNKYKNIHCLTKRFD